MGPLFDDKRVSYTFLAIFSVVLFYIMYNIYTTKTTTISAQLITTMSAKVDILRHDTEEAMGILNEKVEKLESAVRTLKESNRRNRGGAPK